MLFGALPGTWGCSMMSRDPPAHLLRRARLSGLALLALAGSGLAACGGAETVSPQVPAVEREIRAWLEEETGDEIDDRQLKLGYIDLNGDGADEAFALSFNEDHCEETACRGWIFQRRPAAAGEEEDEDDLHRRVVPVGMFESFVLPVASRERSTRGWRDVIVRDPRSGRDLRLRFDGTAYR